MIPVALDSLSEELRCNPYFVLDEPLEPVTCYLYHPL